MPKKLWNTLKRTMLRLLYVLLSLLASRITKVISPYQMHSTQHKSFSIQKQKKFRSSRPCISYLLQKYFLIYEIFKILMMRISITLDTTAKSAMMFTILFTVSTWSSVSPMNRQEKPNFCCSTKRPRN